MRFIPKTEDEIAKEGLLPDGIYGFEVTEAEDTTAKKSGADMIHVKLKVFDGEGGFRFVDDYLLEVMMHKVKHIADTCGLADAYSRGELDAAALIGRTGEVKIKTQQDKEKLYPPKNAVVDYMAPKEGAAPPARAAAPRKPAAASADPFGDDDIPF